MKQEIVSQKGYSHFLIKFKIPFVRHYLQFSLQLFPEMKKSLGITNRCENGKYVLFMDYDDISKDELIVEIKRLQADFSLGKFYVFELDRPDSFHAICCTQLTVFEVREILKESSSDAAFVNAPRLFQRNRWILRIGPKGNRNPPKFAFAVEGPFSPDESTPHRSFLAKYYGTGEPYDDKDSGSVEFAEYETASRVSP